MKTPSHLEDLERRFPTEALVATELKSRFRRYANMPLSEVRETKRILELHKIFVKERQRKERQAEDDARAKRIQ